VVIVIDGGPWWTYLARRALYRASSIWGGAGFAIVPHHAGRVHPVLLRACQIYDPDHVLAYHLTVADLEHFTPGWFQIRGEDGKLLEGEERQQMLVQALEQQIAMAEDLTARDETAVNWSISAMSALASPGKTAISCATACNRWNAHTV
jgi:hypothetical protein